MVLSQGLYSSFVRSFKHSRQLEIRAKSAAVFPALLAWFGSAPMFSSVAIALACSVCAASIKAVIPKEFVKLGLAPAEKSISVKLVRREYTAAIRAVPSGLW